MLRVGNEIDTYCGRCKMDRTHRIVAMDPDGTIRQVICGMCDSRHNYHAPKKSKVAVRKSSVNPLDAETAIFPQRSYQMSSSYNEGEVIDHPKFGVGRVIAVKNSQKIEVQFKDGVRILLQNR